MALERQTTFGRRKTMKHAQLTATQVLHQNAKETSRIRNAMILLAIVVLGTAVATQGTALAQNIQGPAAPNFETSSSPLSGGITSTAPNAKTVANQQPLYDYAPSNPSGQATDATAPNEQIQPPVGYVPRWGMQLASNWSESQAWATYRLVEKQYASLIGNREPIVIPSTSAGMGTAIRYNIRIADDDRPSLEKLCQTLIAAGGACVVLPNDRG
jgi:hypothetical protein